MSQLIVWNRRSGKDRRATHTESNPYDLDDRRIYDRRLFKNNDYLLIIGQVGVDRFTLLVAAPTLVMTMAVLLYGAWSLS